MQPHRFKATNLIKIHGSEGAVVMAESGAIDSLRGRNRACLREQFLNFTILHLCFPSRSGICYGFYCLLFASSW